MRGFRQSSAFRLANLGLPSWRDSPTICFSDTHLVAREGFLSDDAPATIVRLLRAFSERDVFVLGDFFEGLLPQATAADLVTSERLQELFRHLRNARRLCVVPGNHDLPVLDALAELFGPDCLFQGGFEERGIRFMHGHEAASGFWEATGLVAKGLVPLYVTLRRAGVIQGLSGIRNDEILPSRTAFSVFGHTHRPELTRSYANTGSILRGSFGTAVLLDSHVRLIEVDADE